MSRQRFESPTTMTTFYVQKGTVIRLLQAIAGNPGRFPGDPQSYAGLQSRTDLTGKQARKIAQNRRALSKVQEEIEAERLALIDTHRRMFPPEHEQAGQPMPDEHGIPPVADMAAFERDAKDMYTETVAITCPGFLADELDALSGDGKTPLGIILDILADLEVGGESTLAPGEIGALDRSLALVPESCNECHEPIESDPQYLMTMKKGQLGPFHERCLSVVYDREYPSAADGYPKVAQSFRSV